MKENWIKATIVERIQESKDVFILRVKPEQTIEYITGEFVMLAVPEHNNDAGNPIKKAFSITTCCHKHYTDYIEFCIKIFESGALSPKLGSLKVGDTLLIDGPYGKFTMDEHGHDLVFIAGGTGIAPMMAFMRNLLNNESKRNITLLYSTRTKADQLYDEELQHIASDYENIKFVISLTQEKGAQESGRINMDMIKKYVPELNDKTFFICGPLGMVKELKTSLLENSVVKDQIKTDVW